MMRETGSALSGAREVLERLRSTPGVVQTVLSGNLAANARLKLGAFGLDGFMDWDVGAFGSDHEDRTKLVPIAVDRVDEVRGIRFDPEDTWVVGDTPADVACARAGGTNCLLVATGRYDVDSLRDAGADVLLEDLSETDHVVGILMGDHKGRHRRRVP